MANMFSKLRGAVGTLLRGVGNLLNGGAGEAPVVTVTRRSAGRRAAAVRVVAAAGALVLGAALVAGFTACDDGTDDGGSSKPAALANDASYDDFIAKCEEVIAYCEKHSSSVNDLAKTGVVELAKTSEATYNTSKGSWIVTLNANIATLE